ncbi:MAG TPA: hypothetical protein DEP18_04895 [Flavobacteriales bacterium]|nr:hypothetical protein [Flavobacteriales bacterium]HRE73770.1 hypothetical protein [Flavobacteriales bacterium]HRE95669.1 hypothetical protein [Flavobacteriales bacterium]HRJ39689.1 hypothetical protein [Flavobacteriales bacterium]
MNINRHNYEAWFLDYSEGNLSAEQVAELFLFLDQHPELRSELEEFDNILLEDDTSSFDKKEALHKINFTQDEFESLCIKEIEGSLSSDEKAILEKILLQQNDLIKEHALFQKTKLGAETISNDEQFFSLKGISPVNSNPARRDVMLVAYTEGWLSADEMKQVEALAEKDADLKRDFQLYQKTNLRPEQIPFKHKSSLHKGERAILPLYIKRAIPYFAAAAMVIFVFTFLLPGEKPQGLAVKSTIPSLQTDAFTTNSNNDVLIANEDEAVTISEYSTENKNKHSNQTASPKKKFRKEIISIPQEIVEQQLPDVQDSATFAPGIQIQYANNSGDSLNNRTPDQEEESVAYAAPSDRLTIREFIQRKANRKLFGKETVTREEVNASIAQQASRLTGMDISYRSAQEQELKEVQFSVGNFGFSRKAVK